MRNLWTAVVVILSTLILLDKGNCQDHNKNGEQQNWGNEWRNWAGTMMGNGGSGRTGSGNPWSQKTDRYMSQWKPDYVARKTNGTNQKSANEWRNWAVTMMGYGGPGRTGSGNPWLQMADRYMSQWMPDYATRKANGTNQTGGFFESLNNRINKTKKEKKNKKKDKVNFAPYIA